MHNLSYYLDFLLFNYSSCSTIVKIAIGFSLFYFCFILFMIIFLSIKRFIQRKQNFSVDKASGCYKMLESLVTDSHEYSFDEMGQRFESFKSECFDNKRKTINMLSTITTETNRKVNKNNVLQIAEQLQFSKYWENILNKGKVYEKLRSLDEIVSINATITESTLTTLLYHKNDELRKRARIAQINLSQHDPFRFFAEEFDKTFSEWDKIKIHNMLTERSLKMIPNFARWIPQIKNTDLQSFLIFEIGYFKQYDNVEYVFKVFSETIDDKVKIQCVKTIGELETLKYILKLTKFYTISSTEVRQNMIETFTKFKDDKDILKFFVEEFDKSYETDIKIAVGHAIYQNQTFGQRVIDVFEKKAQGFDKLIFEHLKNPLLFN